MSEEYIQLPADSTGKKVRAIKRTVGSNDVYEEITKTFGGSLIYTDTDLTKIVITRDAEGFITKLEYYAGVTKKLTLTLTRDSDKRITQIERS